jgi:hypothetical protein
MGRRGVPSPGYFLHECANGGLISARGKRVKKSEAQRLKTKRLIERIGVKGRRKSGLFFQLLGQLGASLNKEPREGVQNSVWNCLNVG